MARNPSPPCAPAAFATLLLCLLLGSQGQQLDAAGNAFTTEHYRGPVAQPDIVIGAMVDVHEWNSTLARCSRRQRGVPYLVTEAIRHTVMAVNERTDLLPGVTLGFDIVDVCSSEFLAVRAGVEYVTAASGYGQCSAGGGGGGGTAAGGNATGNGALVPVVLGPMDDLATLDVASLLGLFDVPLISYTVTDPRLSNDCRYRRVGRTIASDAGKMTVLLAVMRRFGWNYLSAVRTADDSSAAVVGDLVSVAGALAPTPICVNASPSFVLPVAYTDERAMDRTVRSLWEGMPVLADGSRSNLVFLRLRGAEARVRAFLAAILRLAANETVGDRPLFRFFYDDSLFSVINTDVYRDQFIQSVGLGPDISQAIGSPLDRHYRSILDNTSGTDNPWWSARAAGSMPTAFALLAADAVQAAAVALNATLQRTLAESAGRFESIAAVARHLRATRRRIDLFPELLAVNVTSWNLGHRISFNGVGDLDQNLFDVFGIRAETLHVRFETSELPPACTAANCSAVANGDDRAPSLSSSKGKCTSTFDLLKAVVVGMRTMRFADERVAEATLLKLLAVRRNESSVDFTAVCTAPCPPGSRAIVGASPCCWRCERCEENYFANGSNSAACLECPPGQVSEDNRTACRSLLPRHVANTGSLRYVIFSLGALGLLLALPMLASAVHWQRAAAAAEDVRWSCGSGDMTVTSLVGTTATLMLSVLEVREPSDALCGAMAPLLSMAMMVALAPVFVGCLQRFAELHRLSKYEKQERESSSGGGGGGGESVFERAPAADVEATAVRKRAEYSSTFGTSMSMEVFEAVEPAAATAAVVELSDDAATAAARTRTTTTTLSVPSPRYISSTAYCAIDSGGGHEVTFGPTTTTTTTAATAVRSRSARQSIGDFGRKIGGVVRRRGTTSSSNSLTEVLVSRRDRLLVCGCLVGAFLLLQIVGLAMSPSKSELVTSGHERPYLRCELDSISQVSSILVLVLAMVMLGVNILNHIKVRAAHVRSSLDVTSAFMCFVLLIVFLVDWFFLSSLAGDELQTSIFPVAFALAVVVIVHLPKFMSHWRHSWLAAHNPKQLEIEHDRAEVMEGLSASPRQPRRALRSSADVQSCATVVVPATTAAAEKPSAAPTATTSRWRSPSPNTASTSSAPASATHGVDRCVDGVGDNKSSSTSSAPPELVARSRQMPVPRIQLADSLLLTDTSGYASGDLSASSAVVVDGGVATASTTTSGDYRALRSRCPRSHADDGESGIANDDDSATVAEPRRDSGDDAHPAFPYRNFTGGGGGAMVMQTAV